MVNPAGPPSIKSNPITYKGMVAWLSILTAVFSTWLIVTLAMAIAKLLSSAAAQAASGANAVDKAPPA